MAASAVLFALMNFFAKLANASAGWAMVGFVRAFVGALVAIAVARASGRSLGAHDKKAVLLRSVLGTVSMIGTFYALSSRSLSLGDTVTLLYLTPVFLALLAPLFLGEKTTGAVFIGILVSLSGVVLVVRPSFLFGVDGPSLAGGAGPSAGVTAAVAVGVALTSSLAMMALRRVGKTETPESVAMHFSLFAAMVLGVVAVSDLHVPSARDVGFMTAAGVCAGFGQIAMGRAYARETAARVGGLMYVAPVTSAVLGALALGEVPSALATLGMGLVIGGGLVVTFTRNPRPG